MGIIVVDEGFAGFVDANAAIIFNILLLLGLPLLVAADPPLGAGGRGDVPPAGGAAAARRPGVRRGRPVAGVGLAAPGRGGAPHRAGRVRRGRGGRCQGLPALEGK